jgi:hypothetical protein
MDFVRQCHRVLGALDAQPPADSRRDLPAASTGFADSEWF